MLFQIFQPLILVSPNYPNSRLFIFFVLLSSMNQNGTLPFLTYKWERKKNVLSHSMVKCSLGGAWVA